MSHLQDYFQTVDDLLAADVENLGLGILKVLESWEEAKRKMGTFHLHSHLVQIVATAGRDVITGQGYDGDQEVKKKIKAALTKAWNYLTEKHLIVRDESSDVEGCFKLTQAAHDLLHNSRAH